MMKDTQLNHSKLFRMIEKKLKELQIPYNSGVIIQMSFEGKKQLYEKVSMVYQFRVVQQNKRQDDDKNSIKFNLSENNIAI